MSKYYYRVEMRSGNSNVALEKHKRPQRCFEELRQLMKQTEHSDFDLQFLGIVKREKDTDKMVGE